MTTTASTYTATPVILQAGEGAHVLQMRACVTSKLPVAASEGGRVSAAEFLLPAGFGPALHVHHAEDEILVILEGSVRIVCADSDVVVNPGGFAFLPRDVPHTFSVSGGQSARMLAVFTPGGVEELFLSTGTPTDHECLPERGIDSPSADFEAATARYQVEHLGPPLGA